METIICGKCSIEKDISNYHSGKGKFGKNHWCKECINEYNRMRYKNADIKLKLDMQHKERIERIKKWILEYKSTLKCSECSENHPACLDFHHIDETQKEYTIGSDMRSHNIGRILKEISKCVVLCSNCHRKLHYKVSGYPMSPRDG